jgi:hypothetical protein
MKAVNPWHLVYSLDHIKGQLREMHYHYLYGNLGFLNIFEEHAKNQRQFLIGFYYYYYYYYYFNQLSKSN